MTDPTWLQIGVALIALGASLISAVAVADPAGSSGDSRSQTSTFVLWLGFVLNGLGVVILLVNAWTAWSRWRDDRKTPFELVFDSNDPECVYQTTALSGLTCQLRVRVTNRGSSGVERVRVHMTVSGGHHSYFLHIRHDNEPFRLKSREGEYLTVGQDEYFDVACWNTQRYFLTFADVGIEGAPVATGAHAVTLTAMGWRGTRDVEPLTKHYTLTVGPPPTISLIEV